MAIDSFLYSSEINRRTEGGADDTGSG